MKGIILAGGRGSRLHPITKAVSKQLLPIYDKPMIFYPLSVLMLAGIRDILVITTEEDKQSFIRLLGDGSQFGVQLQFAVQENPGGIAQALIIGESFIGTSPACLILGDNIFFGSGLTEILQQCTKITEGAIIFGYRVDQANLYGVVEFNEQGEVINIVEKPQHAKSDYAVTGLYFYDNQAIGFAKTLKPSARGELEITDLNNLYLQKRQLKIEILGRGYAWLDTGTHSSLLEANNFIQSVEHRQGLKIACLEEIAYARKWIGRDQLITQAKSMANTNYGDYLFTLAKEQQQ